MSARAIALGVLVGLGIQAFGFALDVALDVVPNVMVYQSWAMWLAAILFAVGSVGLILFVPEEVLA